MNTDEANNQPDEQQAQLTTNQPLNARSETLGTTQLLTPNPLQTLVSAMQSVDTISPEAKQNATSIDDNNGGRIELNQDQTKTNDFEKIIKK